MPEIVIAWLLVAVGVVGLVWSADRFVAGSAAIASNLGLSKLVIGLTIVSMGTSAPEVLVSINASLVGQGELAVGNALGSNIANIGLVLAITLLIANIPIQKHILFREIPVLLFITALAGVFLYDGQLLFWEGLCLLLIIPPLLYTMVKYATHHPEEAEVETEKIPELKTLAAVIWFVIGLALLILSANLLVRGAQDIALYFGVKPLIIGLTVVAIGTSLPELAASVMSAIRGHHDIALGNIIGSNVFNILAVMSVPGLIGITPMENAVFYRDYIAMAAITLLLCVIIFVDYKRQTRVSVKPGRGHAQLGKITGIALLLCYIGYGGLLFSATAA